MRKSIPCKQIVSPCTPDCKDRTAGCAAGCKKWETYIARRDEIYKVRADGGRLGRVDWERRRTI